MQKYGLGLSFSLDLRLMSEYSRETQTVRPESARLQYVVTGSVPMAAVRIDAGTHRRAVATT
jgi:hypothetical protein